ncbi:amidohydrolase, partial [Streptomyces sp. TRM76130]|nr:amidohydrolase [Streptomyces sp. TRM76130]
GPPGDLTRPAELASAAAAGAHEIVRLEPLAEQVADTSGTVESFLANLAEAVHGAAVHAVAFTSVAGARHGLALAPEPPGPGEVRGAAGRWLAERRAGGELSDPVLLRHLLWIAVASGRPLQLHAGLGEPGPHTERTDPVLLTGFVRATAGLGTDLVLLHGYPYHRHAAHLAGVFS